MSSNRKLKRIPSIFQIEKQIYSSFSKKYTSRKYTFKYISTNNLIFNEKCELVAKFKDFLILDDLTEYLRYYYPKKEGIPRLTKILRFYETYSKIFPNYLILPESEYLYKNIRKKQKMIDAMNEIRREEEENKKQIGKSKKISGKFIKENAVFTPQIQNSINKYAPSDNQDDEMNNLSISISIVSKKLANSFMLEGEKEISIISVLNEINTGNKKKETIIASQSRKNIKRKNSQPKYWNNLLDKHQKGKQFIQKIVTSQSQNLITRESKSKSQKIINENNLTETNTNSNQNLNIYDNFQNLIIPQGNTVININNNYYHFHTSVEANENKEEKNIEKDKDKKNNKVKLKKLKGKNSSLAKKIQDQLSLRSSMLSPQPSMKTTTLYKRKTKPNEEIKIPMSQVLSKKNILSERTKSEKFMKIKNKQTNLYDTQFGKEPKLIEQASSSSNFNTIKSTSKLIYKKNTVIPKKERKISNVNHNTQIKQNTQGNKNNNNNTNNKNNKNNKNSINNREQQINLTENQNTISTSSPKKSGIKKKESCLSTTMKDRYKEFLYKIKLKSNSNTNSKENFFKTMKSKKSFTRNNLDKNSQSTLSKQKRTIIIHHSHSRSTNESKKNINSQKYLKLKSETPSFSRSSTAFSPTQTINLNFNKNDPMSPLLTTIKVNRKFYIKTEMQYMESKSFNQKTYENKVTHYNILK